MEIGILLLIDLLFTVPFGIIPGGELIVAFGGVMVIAFVAGIVKLIFRKQFARSPELQNHTVLKLISLSFLEFMLALFICFILGGMNRICFDDGCKTASVGESFMTKALIYGIILFLLMIENIIIICTTKIHLNKTSQVQTLLKKTKKTIVNAPALPFLAIIIIMDGTAIFFAHDLLIALIVGILLIIILPVSFIVKCVLGKWLHKAGFLKNHLTQKAFILAAIEIVLALVVAILIRQKNGYVDEFVMDTTNRITIAEFIGKAIGPMLIAATLLALITIGAFKWSKNYYSPTKKHSS